MDLTLWIGGLVSGIVASLIANELFAWGPRLSELLMRRAVRRLAPEIQGRMQEEWAGHLQEIPPGLWRITTAVEFLLAAHQINIALQVEWKRQESSDRKAEDDKAATNNFESNPNFTEDMTELLLAGAKAAVTITINLGEPKYK